MKKTFKKALCVLLTLIMLTSAVSASAAALDWNGLAYTFTLSADGSGMILTKCSNRLLLEENVVIPAAVDKDNVRYQVVGIGALAFANCTNMKTLTIPEGVKTIGARAFENCTSLISVNIPKTLISCESDAFNGCASVTANCYRANYMFIATFALDSNVKVNVLDKETAADKEAQVNNILDIVMTFVRKIIDIIKGIFSKIAG